MTVFDKLKQSRNTALYKMLWSLRQQDRRAGGGYGEITKDPMDRFAPIVDTTIEIVYDLAEKLNIAIEKLSAKYNSQDDINDEEYLECVIVESDIVQELFATANRLIKFLQSLIVQNQMNDISKRILAVYFVQKTPGPNKSIECVLDDYVLYYEDGRIALSPELVDLVIKLHNFAVSDTAFEPANS